MSIIVFDTETTGLLGPMAMGVELQPCMIEFHGIKLNFELETIDTMSFRCKPPVPVSEGASRVNGITNEMLTNEEPFANKFNGLAEFFTGSLLAVGHNLRFDQVIIYWELVRLGMTLQFPWPYRNVCTVETCQKQLGFRQNLTDMHERLFGTNFTGAHTAMGDCEVTMKCFIEFVRRGVITL